MSVSFSIINFSVQPIYDRDADPLYGILIRIAELDLSGVPRHSSAEEKYKIGQKIERQARRRHSVFVANLRETGKCPGNYQISKQKNILYFAEGLHRSNSAPDVLETVNGQRNGAKRVSFSIEQVQPPSYHTGLVSSV